MKKNIFIAAVLFLLTVSCVTAETIEGKLTVQGACGMCKTRIEKAAQSVNGVIKSEWNLETKVLTLQFDSGKTNLDAISEVLAEVGHDTEKHRTDDKTYDSLPECCKYR